MSAESRLIATLALGHRLPKGAEVHHVDGNHANNTPSNLVICQDHTYHVLLHRRQRAFDICDHAEWVPCQLCGRYANPSRFDPQFPAHPRCIEKRVKAKAMARWQLSQCRRRRHIPHTTFSLFIPVKLDLQLKRAAKKAGCSRNQFIQRVLESASTEWQMTTLKREPAEVEA